MENEAAERDIKSDKPNAVWPMKDKDGYITVLSQNLFAVLVLTLIEGCEHAKRDGIHLSAPYMQVPIAFGSMAFWMGKRAPVRVLAHIFISTHV
jgi:hypothetical protein